MNLSDEFSRHRILTNGPRGLWTSAPGTHGQLMQEYIRFDEDGTGTLGHSSVFSGESAVRFVWRMVAYGVLECEYVDGEDDCAVENQPPSIQRLPFVIQQHVTDLGTFWVLKSAEADEDGFWELTSPVVPAD